MAETDRGRAPAERAERALLGGLLRYNPAIAEVVPLLAQTDFARHAHGLVYGAVLGLWEAGKPADLTTVAESLHRAGQMAELGEGGGGYAWLAGLWEETATGANAAYHAAIVRDHSLLRRLALAGHEVLRLAQEPCGPAAEALEAAERAVFAVASLGAAGVAVTLREAIGAAYARADEREARGAGLSGLPTGFADLDELTAGLQPGELVVLAARPSVGKTALGLQVARRAAGHAPVFFASLEQSRAELAERLLCSESGVDSHALRLGRLTAEQMDRLSAAAGVLRPLPFRLDDSPSQTVLRVAANARRLQARGGLGLVVVDYLQLVEPDDRKAPRHEQVGCSARRLKQLARELRAPVLCLAQLNREIEHRNDARPRLSDLRDSGEIEQHADTVLLMHRPEGRRDLLEVVVAKQRNGPVGSVTLAYEPSCLRFGDTADPFPE